MLRKLTFIAIPALTIASTFLAIDSSSSEALARGGKSGKSSTRSALTSKGGAGVRAFSKDGKGVSTRSARTPFAHRYYGNGPRPRSF